MTVLRVEGVSRQRAISTAVAVAGSHAEPLIVKVVVTAP